MASPAPTPTNATLPKPPSSIFKGYSLKEKTIPFTHTIDRHILRDNFTTSTWILIGASIQCLLLALPIRPSYALLPALSILSYRFLTGLLMIFGIIKHPYADGAVPIKTTVAIPESYAIDVKKKDDGGVCVIILFARCNNPLGIFAPYYKELADRMQSLIFDLDTNAGTNGYLGGNSWLNTSDRSTNSEVMTLVYFKSHDDLQAFAHGKHHREIWDWWNGLARDGKVRHISICHEVYCARKGQWEGIYVNHMPSMFAATSHWVLDEGGVGKWVSPRVEGKGRFRSALGRMGRSDGDDNEKYGEEPYSGV